jgi:hypothetical protein
MSIDAPPRQFVSLPREGSLRKAVPMCEASR